MGLFEVFHRLPLPREALGGHPAAASDNVVRVSMPFDAAEHVLDEVAKTVFTDPSIAVRRTIDDRVFQRDELMAMVQLNRPDWLER